MEAIARISRPLLDDTQFRKVEDAMEKVQKAITVLVEGKPMGKNVLAMGWTKLESRSQT